ncbi:MAG: glutamate-5-semialdehyde dehydrogenase [Xanthomonadales bacterium]|nr:glutamate-5-semialdehyde dehydrogenase [Xanthomonadales bacterium]
MVEAAARAAREGWRVFARSPDRERRELLRAIAAAIGGREPEILAANGEDLERARGEGLAGALLDRALLDHARLAGIRRDLLRVAELPDPLGEPFDRRVLPNGLRLHRRRVPLGVIAAIYEARPNVTVDIAALALRAGNAVLLRGGRETLASNRALVAAIHEALAACGLPPALVGFLDAGGRETVEALLGLDGLVDLLIPRGGEALQRLCRERSRIPVLSGGIGICHLYVDASADLERALAVVENAKVQRPTVCNALDTLLVHEAVAPRFLPRVVERLGPLGVRFRAEPRAFGLLAGRPGVEEAAPGDFDTEWLALVLGLKVVPDLDAAIAHIARHGSGHSDGILAEDRDAISRFLDEVDSAAVYANASTRFTDGGEFGLGAEVAVSTQRLHARGPVGLEGLTTWKWVVEGDYHVRG